MVTVWGEVSISGEEASLKEAEHESRSSENTVFVVVVVGALNTSTPKDSSRVNIQINAF